MLKIKLLLFYAHIVMTLLYEKDTISMEGVKASLHSKELMMNTFREESEVGRRFVCERKNKRKKIRSDKGQSKSNSRGKNNV